MRKIAETTLSGSDSISFYMEKPTKLKNGFVTMADDHVSILHMDLWEDMDSSVVEEYGRYNVQVGHVCVRGFESYSHLGNDLGWEFIGQSVHNALKSCDMHIERDGENGIVRGSIISTYDGKVIAAPRTRAYVLTVAECLWTYGAKDITYDASGNNLRKLLQDGRRAL
jgi:hypothetical protein